MKLFRFMSNTEFQKYQNGEILKNNTIHEAKTNSVGFCFLDFKDYTPEYALHFLSGIVSFDVCAVFETEEKINQSYGIYAKPLEETGDPLSDLIYFIKRFNEKITVNEYCTQKYSNKNMKLIKYSKEIWNQYGSLNNQQKLKWVEV